MSAPAPPSRGRFRELGRFLEIQNLGLNLPFALAFVVLATHGRPPWLPFALLVVAFVGARNAGHSFNRWADLRYDRQNPRTQDRALVSGRYAPSTALVLTAASSAVVVAAAFLLNPLALLLAPVALASVLGYSYTKRYTALTTVFLGWVEAITPAAVYIALDASLPPAVLAAVGGLLAWGTGFEIVHSLGDLASDRELGLKSLPLALGTRRSVLAVPTLHAAAVLLLGAFGLLEHLRLPYFVALGAIAAVAFVIDRGLLRDPGNVARPFRTHMLLGLLYLAGAAAAVYLPWP